MHDINGKSLQNGDTIYTPSLGMLIIRDVLKEHSNEDGGSLIDCIGVARGGQGVELRTHDAKAIKVRTWKELANLALLSSNAVNLGAVVHSFSEVIREVKLRLESEGKVGTDHVNKHPVCVIFAQAIGNMTGSESLTGFGEALDWANKEGR